MANLREFLAQYAERQFEWGQDDCSLLLADWWRANHGVDPAEHLRGTYNDEKSCHRVVFFAGGLPRLIAGICRRMGAEPTRDPQDGDIAVIKVGTKRVCAIKSGEFWAIRNEQIGFLKQVQVIRAWRV